MSLPRNSDTLPPPSFSTTGGARGNEDIEHLVVQQVRREDLVAIMLTCKAYYEAVKLTSAFCREEGILRSPVTAATTSISRWVWAELEMDVLAPLPRGLQMTTCMLAAARCGSEDLARSLFPRIVATCTPELTTEFASRAATEAACAGRTSLMLFFLQQVRGLTFDTCLASCIDAAAWHGQDCVLHSLVRAMHPHIQALDWDRCNGFGELDSPYHSAAFRGCISSFNILLFTMGYGNLSAHDKEDPSYLGVASDILIDAARGGHVDMIKHVQSTLSVDPDVKHMEAACTHGHFDAVKFFRSHFNIAWSVDCMRNAIHGNASAEMLAFMSADGCPPCPSANREAYQRAMHHRIKLRPNVLYDGI